MNRIAMWGMSTGLVVAVACSSPADVTAPGAGSGTGGAGVGGGSTGAAGAGATGGSIGGQAGSGMMGSPGGSGQGPGPGPGGAGPGGAGPGGGGLGGTNPGGAGAGAAGPGGAGPGEGGSAGNGGAGPSTGGGGQGGVAGSATGGSGVGVGGGGPAPCSPELQTGCSGGASKCTVLQPGPMQPLTTGCVVPQPAPLGQAGAACTRKTDASGNPIVGDDSCDKALYCTAISSGTTSRFCRKFCSTNAACGGGEDCIPLAPPGVPDGTCLRTCTILDPSSCAKGTCGDLVADSKGDLVPLCRPVGNGQQGAACQQGGGSWDCAANLFCSPDINGSPPWTCRRFCDPTHPCGGGTSCYTFNMGGSSGVCL